VQPGRRARQTRHEGEVFTPWSRELLDDLIERQAQRIDASVDWDCFGIEDKRAFRRLMTLVSWRRKLLESQSSE
jgi:hypothetical protein